MEQQQPRSLLNYGLTFKKKKPAYLSNFINDANVCNGEANELENCLNSSAIQQYDDLTDVRVIAKMQEDSMLIRNKKKILFVNY